MEPQRREIMIDVVALACLAGGAFAYYSGDLVTGSLVLGGVSGYYFGHRIKK